MTRKATNKLLQLIEDGCIDRDLIIRACLKYMSEDEVADMATANEFLPVDEDEDQQGDDNSEYYDSYEYPDDPPDDEGY